MGRDFKILTVIEKKQFGKIRKEKNETDNRKLKKEIANV